MEKSYRIDGKASEDFHSEQFQRKLNTIFEKPKATMAERLFNGLGWLSRGRQSSSVSERLLFFFTALEALLSDKDAFVPVADSIARHVSVILSSRLDARESIYSEMKQLYKLRSDLVHRGARKANQLNANNLQNFAETCFLVILKEVSLDQKHKDFLCELRSAAHGKMWPFENGHHQRK